MTENSISPKDPTSPVSGLAGDYLGWLSVVVRRTCSPSALFASSASDGGGDGSSGARWIEEIAACVKRAAGGVDTRPVHQTMVKDAQSANVRSAACASEKKFVIRKSACLLLSLIINNTNIMNCKQSNKRSKKSGAEQSDQVTARWIPEKGCRPSIDEAPVFYPNEEEFKDTLKYIESIRPKAEQYGVCRIVPPASWNPPCLLKEKTTWESYKFATRIQRIDRLQNRDSTRTMSSSSTKRRKIMKFSRIGTECSSKNGNIAQLKAHKLEADELFGFEPGSDFTLQEFQKYADDFKEQYFGMKDDNVEPRFNVNRHQNEWEPSVENIEGEFWRIVEKPTEEIEVLYGADIETGVFGSGFPKTSPGMTDINPVDQCVKSVCAGFGCPSSLGYQSLHVEDHYFYSLNYLHWGAPKVWYGISEKNASRLEATMKKHLPDLFEEQPDLLHKLVTQLSPSILKSEGIPVYRCVQNPGEFVITFPQSYHSGFNCGFNCAEAVNLAPIDWLPHGQNAIEQYREQGHKTTISHDNLLLGAAREVVRAHWELQLLKKNTLENLRWKDACGMDGVLAKALQARVKMEDMWRRQHSDSSLSIKMDADFDTACERECTICLYDLHLSAVGCRCCPEKYACLTHAKELCACPWGFRFFLFRYEMSELNSLVEALGGKLSAIYRWAHHHLGLTLSSHVAKNRPEEHQPCCGSSEECTKEINEVSVGAIASTATANNHRLCQGSNDTALHLISIKPKEIEHRMNDKANSTVAATVPIQMQQTRNPLPTVSASNDGSSISTACRKETIDQSRQCVQSGTTPKIEFREHNIPFEEVCSVRNSNISSFQVGQISRGMPCVKQTMKESAKLIPESGQSINSTVEGYERNGFQLGRGDCLGSSFSMVLGRGNNPSCASNALNQYYHHKGPCVTKMVQRINCTVQPLQYGVVIPGKLWSNSKAIFPKGFRSRVRYYSVLDPAKMCFYISEVLDAELPGPIFMVRVEQCPREVFMHVSIAKCWDMVRERVNREIMRQVKMGRRSLPPLQPQECIDGLKMFGFSSPAIIQAIEAIDQKHVCSEYWKCRSKIQVSQHSSTGNLVRNVASRLQGRQNGREANNDVEQQLEAEATVLRGLFKKAKPEELFSLYSMVSNHRWDANRQALIHYLNEERKTRQN
ncbi:hypothetical protein ACLOJK_011469 [Asimina triloba]